MIYLLKYLKPYRKEAIIGPLFKFFEACMEIFVPLIMSQIIDVGIKYEDKKYIWTMGAVLAVIALLGWAFAITAQYFAAKAAMASAPRSVRLFSSTLSALSRSRLIKSVFRRS